MQTRCPLKSLRSKKYQVQVALLLYCRLSRSQLETGTTARAPLKIDSAETVFEESESLKRGKGTSETPIPAESAAVPGPFVLGRRPDEHNLPTVRAAGCRVPRRQCFPLEGCRAGRQPRDPVPMREVSQAGCPGSEAVIDRDRSKSKSCTRGILSTCPNPQKYLAITSIHAASVIAPAP